MDRIVIEVPEEHVDFVVILALALRVGTSSRVKQELEDELHAALDLANRKQKVRAAAPMKNGALDSPRNSQVDELTRVRDLHTEALQWFLRLEQVIDILKCSAEPEAKSNALPNMAMCLDRLAERTNARRC